MHRDARPWAVHAATFWRASSQGRLLTELTGYNLNLTALRTRLILLEVPVEAWLDNYQSTLGALRVLDELGRAAMFPEPHDMWFANPARGTRELMEWLSTLATGATLMAILGVTYKTGTGRLLSWQKPSQFVARALDDDIQAVRLPTSYKGQRHLPGYLWMSRMNALVAYESRLEMTILLQLDFNKAVANVVSQPFVLHYLSESNTHHHTPDFFVRYSDGNGEVVNVKPRQFVKKPKNVRDFEACQTAAIEMGCAYSTRSELDTSYLANLGWLAGYRRPPAELTTYGEAIINAAMDPIPIQAVFARIEASPTLIRPILFHMLWTGWLATDLHTRLTRESPVWVPAPIGQP
jgi:hypothetical protein